MESYLYPSAYTQSVDLAAAASDGPLLIDTSPIPSYTSSPPPRAFELELDSSSTSSVQSASSSVASPAYVFVNSTAVISASAAPAAPVTTNGTASATTKPASSTSEAAQSSAKGNSAATNGVKVSHLVLALGLLSATLAGFV